MEIEMLKPQIKNLEEMLNEKITKISKNNFFKTGSQKKIDKKE